MTKQQAKRSKKERAVVGIRQAQIVERRRALLEAANAEFLLKGYEKATLDDIIARAGGSRSTIYKEFGNKADLFSAIGVARSEELLCMLHEQWDREGNVRDALRRYAYAYVKALLEPAILQLHKSAVCEAAHLPELATALFDIHTNRVFRPIESYLRHRDELGELRVKNPELSAKLFIAMAKGGLQLQAMVSPRKTITRVEIERHVNFAVDIFLKGVEG